MADYKGNNLVALTVDLVLMLIIIGIGYMMVKLGF